MHGNDKYKELKEEYLWIGDIYVYVYIFKYF